MKDKPVSDLFGKERQGRSGREVRPDNIFKIPEGRGRYRMSSHFCLDGAWAVAA